MIERAAPFPHMKENFDVLVVGSGIAGSWFALKMAAKNRRVAILTKKNQAESNTNYAQGGIACVMSETDDFESHIKDTLVAGDGLCDEAVVREIVSSGPQRIQELIDLGLQFSKTETGEYDLGREGGHSERRILHVKDMTGKAIETALLNAVEKSPLIEVFEHHFAIDLVTNRKTADRNGEPFIGEERILGLYALDVRHNRVCSFSAPVVLLATGGIGQVYRFTTNPDIATGDGVAMAYRAGVPIRNMEFIQFHPTTLYTLGNERFLISEAVRGEGAILRNLDGSAFMADYHPQADLAPRDVVARAIDEEMKKTGAQHVWLDIRHHPEEYLRERFPNIFETCERLLGLNLSHDLIPVVPAAHYSCGGVSTNIDAETALPGLYACGEVACTGLHGANRLASNSLLEALVLAHNGAAAAERYLSKEHRLSAEFPAWVDLGGNDPDERVVISHNWDELRLAMWDYVGIVRSTNRLKRARTRIENLAAEIQEYYWSFSVDSELLELRNLIQVAGLVVECALQREESRGLHETINFPQKLETARDSFAEKAVVSPEVRGWGTV